MINVRGNKLNIRPTLMKSFSFGVIYKRSVVNDTERLFVVSVALLLFCTLFVCVCDHFASLCSLFMSHFTPIYALTVPLCCYFQCFYSLVAGLSLLAATSEGLVPWSLIEIYLWIFKSSDFFSYDFISEENKHHSINFLTYLDNEILF